MKIRKDQIQGTPEPKVENSETPIVGIGASAGGLEAMTSLLENLQTDTGLSFIVVQHMATDQENMLTSILSRSTKMPVLTIENGMMVKQNQVYVVPPGKSLTLTGGRHLKLVPRNKSIKPIDTFFSSLAQVMGMQAIGIILSGTGSDGTEGFKEIKSEGGITFAQDPKTAQYRGMPESTISSEMADFVLSPDKIAQELSELAGHPQLVRAKIGIIKAPKETGIEPVFALLKSNFRVDFSHYKETFLNRRISRRMVINHLHGTRAYIDYLRENPNELQALFNDLLVGVTNFFREPKTFVLLKEKVFPELVKKRINGQPIRVWIPGSSSGEEAYSIAIALLEFLEEKAITNVQIQIFGTDANEKNIVRARQGIYSNNIESNLSKNRLEKFFNRVNGSYQIAKFVRDICLFAKQDITADPPFSKLDLVSCRNMLIYFDSQLQERVVPVLHYALKPNGFLVLGESESIGNLKDLFEPLTKNGIIYVKKESRPNVRFSLDAYAFTPGKTTSLPTKKEFVTLIAEEVDKLLLTEYVPASVLVNSNLDTIMIRGNVSPYLKLESGVVSLNLIKVIRKELRSEIQSLVYRAKKENKPVSEEVIHIGTHGSLLTVDVKVIPLKLLQTEAPFFLLLFEDVTSEVAHLERIRRLTSTPEGRESIKDQQILELTAEVESSKRSLQKTIEELEATNEELRTALEEIQSSNEELQSTNEELETAKEELQSSNEELTTLNDELKNRNDALARINYDLDNMSRNVDSAVVMVDSDLRIRLFTPSAEKILKITPSEISLPITAVRLGVAIEHLEVALNKAISDKRMINTEVKDDNGRVYEMRIRPYLTEKGKIDGAVLAFLDITELKKADGELRKYRIALEKQVQEGTQQVKAQADLLDKAHEAIIVRDLDGRITYWNKGAEGIYGYTSKEAVGKNAAKLIFKDKTQYDFAVKEVIAKGKWNGEVKQVTKDGKEVIVDAHWTLVSDKDMKPRSIMGISIDVTEKKKLEDQYLRAQRLESIGTLAGGIAHDFRNILTPITITLGLIDQHLTQKEDHEMIAALQKNLQRGADLAKQLLSFTRGVEGERVPISIPSLIFEVEKTIKETFPKSISIETKVDHDLPEIIGDSTQLHQVLINMCINARDAMPFGGTLTIGGESVFVDHTYVQSHPDDMVGPYVMISVIDNGVGMPPEVLERLYEPFFTTKKLSEGTGLGLSTARSIVRSHSGFINVYSEVGKGTTFKVYLPVTAIKGELHIEPAKTELPQGSGQTVLVVDDEKLIRLTILTALENNGYRALEAGDGAEALGVYTEHKDEISAVLIDMAMPIMDGEAAIRALRKINPLIKIIGMSGLAEYGRYRAMHDIANGFIEKPFTVDSLFRMIAQVLANSTST